MEPTETPVIPIAQPEPAAPAAEGGAAAMMARFSAMKAAEAEAAPATPEPKAPDPQVEPADDTPEPVAPTPENPQQAKPEAGRAKWGELKAKAQERDELVNTKLPTLEKELTDLRAKAAKFEEVDPTRYEKQIAEKEAAIAKYEQKLAVYDVRESAPFKNEVIAPMTRVAGDMDRLAATYKVDAQALKDALTISDPAAQMARINELTADMTELHKNKVWSAVDKTQEIYAKAAEIEANAFEAKKEMEFIQHQETEREKQERQRTLSTAAEAVKKQMLEHLPMLKDEAIANDVFGADLNVTDPTLIAYNAMMGKAGVHLVKDLRAKDARIQELEKELAKRAAVSVKAGGGGSTQSAPESTNGQYEGTTLWDRAKAAAAAGHITLAGRKL